MESADVGINTRLAERDSEASYSGWRLCQPVAILGSCLEKARVHTIGSGIEHALTCTVCVYGHVGGRRNRILWFGPESDCVRRDRIFVGPFYRVARMNRDNGSLKRITESVSEPAPVATTSPAPTVTPFCKCECWCFGFAASSSASKAVLSVCPKRSFLTRPNPCLTIKGSTEKRCVVSEHRALGPFSRILDEKTMPIGPSSDTSAALNFRGVTVPQSRSRRSSH